VKWLIKRCATADGLDVATVHADTHPSARHADQRGLPLTRQLCPGRPDPSRQLCADADPDSSYDQVQWHGTGWLADRPSVAYDTLPAGEVGVRGGEPVHATDGNIGQIQGLVIDSASHQVTHVLLQEGHVFGRKVVAIPTAAVTGAGQNGIQLGITRQQVKDLPSGWHRSPG
jgi:hypothetical protein